MSHADTSLGDTEGHGGRSNRACAVPFGLRPLLVLVAGIGFGLIVCVVNATAFTGQVFLSKLLGGIWAWICVPYVVAWAKRHVASFLATAHVHRVGCHHVLRLRLP